MNKLNQSLKKDNVQRICYTVLLICWIFIALNAEFRFYITSSADYLPLIFIIPVMLLVLQILFNNRVIWSIILVCIGLFTLWIFIQMYMYIVMDYHRDYSHIEWKAGTVFQLLSTVFILILFNWFILKIKPVKRDTRITPNEL